MQTVPCVADACKGSLRTNLFANHSFKTKYQSRTGKICPFLFYNKIPSKYYCKDVAKVVQYKHIYFGKTNLLPKGKFLKKLYKYVKILVLNYNQL